MIFQFSQASYKRTRYTLDLTKRFLIGLQKISINRGSKDPHKTTLDYDTPIYQLPPLHQEI